MQTEILRAGIQNFLKNQEEQELLGLFHKMILSEKEHLFLLDTEKDTIEPIQIEILEYSQKDLKERELYLKTPSFCFSIWRNRRNESYYINRIFSEKITTDSTSLSKVEEENYQTTLMRYRYRFQIEEPIREDLIIKFQGKEEDQREPWFYGIHLSSGYLAFETTDIQQEHTFFSSLYIEKKDYLQWQEARMRKTLRQAYQQNPELMKHLEEKHQYLKSLSNTLLPHRFESIIGCPYLKIIR